MKPSIGRVVHYVLTEDDATQINRRRTTGQSIGERIKEKIWPIGAQAHIGNTAHEGDHYPTVVVKVWPESINGQATLDGNDTFWVTSRQEGTGPGTWHWPEREE